MVARIQREIDLGYGDARLRFILNWVKSGRTLFECDKKYLARRLVHYAESEARRHKKLDRPVARRLEQRAKRIEDNIEENDFRRISQTKIPLIQEEPEASEQTVVPQVKVIVAMRKDLHHILVKLDKLEEKFRGETRYQESQYDIMDRKRELDTFDLQSEAPTDILETPREKLQEKKEASQSSTAIQKNRPGLRVFASILLVTSVITIGAFLACMASLGNPAMSQQLEQYGITNDQVIRALNLLVPAMIINLGTWATFGIIYLQTTRKAKKL